MQSPFMKFIIRNFAENVFVCILITTDPQAGIVDYITFVDIIMCQFDDLAVNIDGSLIGMCWEIILLKILLGYRDKR